MLSSSVILGVDYGARRSGIAVARENIAFPLTVVHSPALIETLEKFAIEESVDTIVVGLPRRLDGSESDTTHRVRSFAGRLGRALSDIAIELWDERLSSVEASHVLAQMDARGPDDAIAASIMLQNFLDTNHL